MKQEVYGKSLYFLMHIVVNLKLKSKKKKGCTLGSKDGMIYPWATDLDNKIIEQNQGPGKLLGRERREWMLGKNCLCLLFKLLWTECNICSQITIEKLETVYFWSWVKCVLRLLSTTYRSELRSAINWGWHEQKKWRG